MSYDEHLISMAGGDGDMLEAIQRHGVILTEWEQFLLDRVREQAAKLAAVRELHVREVLAVHEGYGEEAWCPACRIHWPCMTAAALEPTP